jgi:hypothetical protein
MRLSPLAGLSSDVRLADGPGYAPPPTSTTTTLSPSTTTSPPPGEHIMGPVPMTAQPPPPSTTTSPPPLKGPRPDGGLGPGPTTAQPPPPSTQLPLPSPTDNSGLAADAATQDRTRLTLQQRILSESDTNIGALAWDMGNYQVVTDREMDDLTNQMNNLTNELTNTNLSGPAMMQKSNQLAAVLQQIQNLQNEREQVNQSATLQAQQLQRENDNNNQGKIPVSAVDFTPENYNSGQSASNGYIASALQRAGITDPTAVQNWTKGMDVAAPRLSSTFNPSAVDLSDSNAHGPKQVDGNPLNADRGAFQMTPATFAQYHVAGTSTDIYDPVANGAAAVNYIEHRYHVNADGSNLASKVQEFDPNRGPKGY